MSIATPSYENTLVLVRQLKIEDQLLLMEALAELVRQRLPTHPPHSILELRGVGKELWRNIDPQTYIRQERAAWVG